MDEQIARMMFDTVADIVAKYAQKPTSKEDLAAKLGSKLTFFDDVALSKKPKEVKADVFFYTDSSKKEKVQVHVSCETTKEGIVAQGSVNIGREKYVSFPHIYKGKT